MDCTVCMVCNDGKCDMCLKQQTCGTNAGANTDTAVQTQVRIRIVLRIRVTTKLSYFQDLGRQPCYSTVSALTTIMRSQSILAYR